MIVEVTAVIEASIETVMQSVSDVESIPIWATVTGVIDNVHNRDPGLTYDWRFTVDGLDLRGKSEVIEQTANTFITKTTGDIASIWTVTLTPVSRTSTTIQVVVEYTPPNYFFEILADVVIQRYATPEVANENMKRFKEMVEERAKVLETYV